MVVWGGGGLMSSAATAAWAAARTHHSAKMMRSVRLERLWLRGLGILFGQLAQWNPKRASLLDGNSFSRGAFNHWVAADDMRHYSDVSAYIVLAQKRFCLLFERFGPSSAASSGSRVSVSRR